jgi:hypothetical protein
VRRRLRPEWPPRDPYLVLAIIVIALMLSHTLKQKWGSGTDVWEHIAAVRELADRPFGPLHPLVGTDADHQFFTPYSLLIAGAMRITGWHVLTAFGVFGMLNLGLVIFGLHRFVKSLGASSHVAFYSLLFTLFLWGHGAWFFSGFLHFNVIAHVLSYPSTFALGLTLVALSVHVEFLRQGDLRRLAGVTLAAVVVLLSHPITFTFFAVGLAALAVALEPQRWRAALVPTAAALGAAVVAGLLWPYFSIYDLLFGGSPEVEGAYREALDGVNRDLYVRVAERLLPALVIVPFVALRARRWRREPLILMMAALTTVYVYGWVRDVGAYSRTLTFLLLVGTIIVGQELVKAHESLAGLRSSVAAARRWIYVSTAVLLAMGVVNLRNGFSVLPDRLIEDVPYNWLHNEVGFTRFEDYEFLEENHDRYEVVLSDIYTSLEVPAFGSRVVSAARAQPFADTRERSGDLERFFAPNASSEDRRSIIDRYDVSLLIITQERLRNEPEHHKPMLELGRVVSSNDRFVFVEVDPDAEE